MPYESFHRVSGVDCGDEVATWLQACLNMPGVRLLRQHDDDGRSVRPHQGQGQEQPEAAAEASVHLLSLANEAQLLAISQVSCRHLVTAGGGSDVSEDLKSMGLRFRPNLVLDGPGPEFVEDLWQQIVVNGNIMLVIILLVWFTFCS